MTPALDRPGLAVALLFATKPTDRALTGWKPDPPVSPNEDIVREQCRDAGSFT